MYFRSWTAHIAALRSCCSSFFVQDRERAETLMKYEQEREEEALRDAEMDEVEAWLTIPVLNIGFLSSDSYLE